MPEDKSEDLSERRSPDMSERMSKKLSEKEYQKICQKEYQKICQKQCQKISQKICQKECQKVCQKICQKECQEEWNVMCMHASQQSYCCVMWCGSLQQILLAQRFVCKQVSLVWQPCRGLWWNVLRRSLLGRPAGLPKELRMCGTTRWLRCAWSRLALRMLAIVCSLCQRLWREPCGMWRMKGGLLQMRRASKSWRSVLQSSERWRRFGRLEFTSGKPMLCRAEPPNTEERHLASWLTHATRCSCGCVLTCMASWDSTAFGWRGCLMHVMYICIHRLFAPLDLTAFWRGGLMQSNATVELPFDRHKVVMDITFAAWREVNIEFVEWLVWSCGCYVLSLICQKECQKIYQKACQKICQKECQKICQKELQKICQKECQKISQKECQKICQKACQKICQKESQKIASNQFAKLRITERMSGDELYVYPHLTRSGWHEIQPDYFEMSWWGSLEVK